MDALRTKLQLLLGEAVSGGGIDSSWKAKVQSEEITLQHSLVLQPNQAVLQILVSVITKSKLNENLLFQQFDHSTAPFPFQ